MKLNLYSKHVIELYGVPDDFLKADDQIEFLIEEIRDLIEAKLVGQKLPDGFTFEVREEEAAVVTVTPWERGTGGA